MPYITSIERSGIRKGLLKGIEALLRVRFGDSGLQLLPQIREVYDHEKIEAILEAIETAPTPEALPPLWQGENTSAE